MDQNTSLTDKEAEQVLSGICIPPCPAILTKLMKEMRGDEPDFGKITRLISEDASLAAAMLKTVNSAFYGLRNKATSVQQAIILLGLREVRRLTTRILLRDAFSSGSSERMEQYWESSSAIAQISSFLAGHFGGFDRDEAFTYALFRDCGMLAMMDSYEDYKPVLPGDALPGLYTACDALVHPYRAEAFGLTMLEAMACGLTVIAPDHGPAGGFLLPDAAVPLPAHLVRAPTNRFGPWTMPEPPLVGEVHVEDLAAAMRAAYDDPAAVAARAARAVEVAGAHTWFRAAGVAADRLRMLATLAPAWRAAA